MCCFGFGLLLGYNVESWLLCCAGGIVLLVMGICMMGGR